MANNQGDHKIPCPNSDTLRVKGDNYEIDWTQEQQVS